ncbi:ATP-binding cassette domain-containing protein [Fundidesulfovibrio butyratiphilus]
MIEIKDLRLEFPGFAFGPVSLRVEAGAFFAIMGPTGSGKTLLLESLAGLTKPQHGRIVLDGQDITRLPPEGRGMGLVYQDNALFPHMTVLENIVYGQRYHGIGRAEGARLARELAEMLRITPLLDRKPAGLSGGEKQRTAIARALACKPGVVLLDEPLSSLDPQFREGLRQSLIQLHQATGAVFFMVTHDFVDALTLADHTAVINKGRLEQAGPTLDIFQKPATVFIARFVGMENIFPATYADGRCHFAGLSLALGPGQGQPGERGHAAIRPEDIAVGLNLDAPEHWVSLDGEVVALDRIGFAWTAVVQCGPARFLARLEHRLAIGGQVRQGGRVRLSFDPGAVHHMRAEPVAGGDSR